MLSSPVSHPVTNNHSWETESFHLNAPELRITPAAPRRRVPCQMNVGGVSGPGGQSEVAT